MRLKVASTPDLRCDSIHIISHFVDTTMNCSSNSSTCGVQQQAQAAASTDAAACMMDLLLPDTIIKILKLLWDDPASIIAFSLTCSQAQQLSSDRHLWTDLCRSITDTLPVPLRSVDWSPVTWGLDSHKELYIRLLQPYKLLLQQRVWHTTKMPAGQLLIVDADPPCLHARSVYFRSLQGGPFVHAVFVLKLFPPAKVGSSHTEVIAVLYQSLRLDIWSLLWMELNWDCLMYAAILVDSAGWGFSAFARSRAASCMLLLLPYTDLLLVGVAYGAHHVTHPTASCWQRLQYMPIRAVAAC